MATGNPLPVRWAFYAARAFGSPKAFLVQLAYARLSGVLPGDLTNSESATMLNPVPLHIVPPGVLDAAELDQPWRPMPVLSVRSTSIELDVWRMVKRSLRKHMREA